MKKLTVSQTLFVSHLLIAFVIISSMSVARYNSEWQRQVNFSATLAKQSLQSHVHNYSVAISGINYTAMTMSSTLDSLSEIEDAQFIEVSGISDYSRTKVSVRYLPQDKIAWRADMKPHELDNSKEHIATLQSMLTRAEPQNTLQSRKLSYLLNKAKSEHDLLQDSDTMNQTFELGWQKPNLTNSSYYLDEQALVLHVILPLRNVNGGSIWAVFDAQELRAYKASLLISIAIYAVVALLLVMGVVLWVAFWIVKPLKNLADSMLSPIDYHQLDRLKEINRDDEIGQLVRAYRSLLLKNDRQLESLKAKSDNDALTGLGSRYKYSYTARDYIQRNLELGKVVGLMICDIDNFKAFNDIYGHMEGDKALIDVASRVQRSLTNVDTAFRYGGEEFVILSCRREIAELAKASELMRRSVQNSNQPHKGNPNYNIVTVSIGGASLQLSSEEREGIDYEKVVQQLFVQADEVLYECKRLGRNCSAWVNLTCSEIKEFY